MGLDTTHDAFHGAYSAFNRFRKAVAAAMGGSYPPHDDGTLIDGQWYWGDGFSEKTHPGLKVFFCHSDCDGELTPDECEMIANEMEALLPAIEQQGEGGGHITSRGGYKGVAEAFIAGCRDAATAGEVLEFH